MKALITAAGKRIQLIEHLSSKFTVIGVDCNDLVAAKHFVDEFRVIHSVHSEMYISDLISICRDLCIDVIIPLYEPEFEILNMNKEKISEVGTTLLLSDQSVIDVCNDKYQTYEILKRCGIATPCTYTIEEIRDIPENQRVYPYVVKPISGMGSKDVSVAYNSKQLEFFISEIKDCIVQEFAQGEEYTIDVLLDMYGNIISIVPRRRIEVRAGEVSKSCTINDYSIIEASIQVIKMLKSYARECGEYLRGPFTLQCFMNQGEPPKFIEINPRLGGGVPLSFHAGIDYADYLFKMLSGEKIPQSIGDVKEVTMIRYDQAIFLEEFE